MATREINASKYISRKLGKPDWGRMLQLDSGFMTNPIPQFDRNYDWESVRTITIDGRVRTFTQVDIETSLLRASDKQRNKKIPDESESNYTYMQAPDSFSSHKIIETNNSEVNSASFENKRRRLLEKSMMDELED
ncbi:hypothetical protein ACP4OV_030360 [Aristida adscensionis]